MKITNDVDKVFENVKKVNDKIADLQSQRDELLAPLLVSSVTYQDVAQAYCEWENVHK